MADSRQLQGEVPVSLSFKLFHRCLIWSQLASQDPNRLKSRGFQNLEKRSSFKTVDELNIRSFWQQSRYEMLVSGGRGGEARLL
uniref:Uncharacterized protein n=1 Tax=Setaria digitata TaxID=48799 RepID=A0A915PPN6_9BILA